MSSIHRCRTVPKICGGEVDDASGAEQTRPDGTFVKEIDEFHGLNRTIRSRSRVAPG